MIRLRQLFQASVIVGIALIGGAPGLALASGHGGGHSGGGHSSGGHGGGGFGGFSGGGLSFGGGGMSFGGGGSSHHSQPHVNIYTPSVPQSYGHPQPRSYTPLYTPQYTQPQYTQPQQQYTQPSTVIPQKNSVPRTSSTPQTASAKPVQPATNTGLKQQAAELTATDIAKMNRQLRDRNAALAGEITQALLAGIDKLINALPGAAQLTPEDRQQLLGAINRGDADAARRLLGAANLESPAGAQLAARALAQQLLAAIGNGANGAVVVAADLVALLEAVRVGLVGDVLIDINFTIGRIAVNQQIIIWLGNAQPGVNPIPPGPNVPIALIPGLAQGLVIPLGFGPVLIGLGQPGDAILLGEGDVSIVSGDLIPIGPPTGEFDGTLLAGNVVLINSGVDLINYNVNQQPYNMKPTFRQSLGAGKSWVVDFDRGGSYGKASYTITDGYYEFKPSDRGWELYKKTFKAKIENLNAFDFYYVINNQRKTLAAGQTAELTGAAPPVIRFENGGGKFHRKKLDSDIYRVALTGDDMLDLYPATAVPSDIGEAIASTAGPVKPRIGLDLAPQRSPAGDLKMPPGFRMFDPVALLSRGEEIAADQKKLPAEFSLFAAAQVRQPVASARTE